MSRNLCKQSKVILNPWHWCCCSTVLLNFLHNKELILTGNDQILIYVLWVTVISPHRDTPILWMLGNSICILFPRLQGYWYFKPQVYTLPDFWPEIISPEWDTPFPCMMNYVAGHINQILHHCAQSPTAGFTTIKWPFHHIAIVLPETFLTAKSE